MEAPMKAMMPRAVAWLWRQGSAPCWRPAISWDSSELTHCEKPPFWLMTDQFSAKKKLTKKEKKAMQISEGVFGSLEGGRNWANFQRRKNRRDRFCQSRHGQRMRRYLWTATPTWNILKPSAADADKKQAVTNCCCFSWMYCRLSTRHLNPKYTDSA